MSEKIETPSLETDVSNMLKDFEELSQKLGIPLYLLLPIISHRELVIINKQLNAMHERLDRLEVRK